MRHIACILAIVLASCSPAEQAGSGTAPAPAPSPVVPSPVAGDPAPPWPEGLPVYDHIVIVVEENKDWSEIIDNPDTPYINDTLKKEGALITNSFGLEHHSQGNYYWLFSGANHGIGFNDVVPADCNKEEYPYECANEPQFMASNLGQQLIAHGKTFKGYSQGLPEIGSTVDHTNYDYPDNMRIAYARKHVPWISFGNVPNGSTVATSSNLPFSEFPADFNDLPTVSFVIPDLENDMHNVHQIENLPDDVTAYCENTGSVCVGDKWLKDNLDAYYQWAKENNSLLIFTFDEDNSLIDAGLTDPFVEIPVGKNCKTSERDKELEQLCGQQNGVVTIFAGAHIIAGEHAVGDGITHVNILRTIESMYGLNKSGQQQVNALNTDNVPAGRSISDDDIITDVFEQVTVAP